MHVRFWNDGKADELILGPYDYVAVKTSRSGGLTAIRMIDQDGQVVAWLNTVAPYEWFVPGRWNRHYTHVMVWEPTAALTLEVS